MATLNADQVSWDVRIYGLDGHGSVRFLTDAAGSITDAYDYDAFGALLYSSTTTQNSYRFAGEQWDSDLGMYYNRARYYKPENGRFWTMDSYQGTQADPLSLHMYIYAHCDPLDRIDPSGHIDLVEITGVMGVRDILDSIKTLKDVAIKQGVKQFKNELLNDASFKDLPENQQLGFLGEAAWVAYLNSIGLKAVQMHRSISANGPDLVAFGQRNGRYI